MEKSDSSKEIVTDESESRGKTKNKSLLQRYKESTFEEIYMVVILPLLCEFSATFVYTMWGSMPGPPNRPDVYVSINRTILPGEYAADYVVSTLMPATQTAIAVWLLIVVFTKMTLINFNPIISLSLMLVGELNPLLFVPYVLVQLLGAVAGAQMTQTMKGSEPGPFRLAAWADLKTVIATEIFNTGILVFFVLAMVVDKRFDDVTGSLAIGFSVFQAGLLGRWVGAFCMNPARAFGPAVVLGEWDNQWVWWLGPTLGALLFTVIYMVLFAPQKIVWILKIYRRLRKPLPPSKEDL